jgi:hypothetical protein
VDGFDALWDENCMPCGCYGRCYCRVRAVGSFTVGALAGLGTALLCASLPSASGSADAGLFVALARVGFGMAGALFLGCLVAISVALAHRQQLTATLWGIGKVVFLLVLGMGAGIGIGVTLALLL